MRTVIFFTTLIFSSLAFAGSVDIKDVDTSDDTTIEIHKGKKTEALPPQAPQNPTPVGQETPGSKNGKWKLQTGSEEVNGEGNLESEAKKAWKESCAESEKKFRAQLKEDGDRFVSWSCGGRPTCSGDAGNKTCTTQSAFKFKTKEDVE